jgi:thiamine kinase-like enzyme
MDATVRHIIRLIPELQGKKISARPLEGGLTNRNYLLKSGRERFVLRISGENSEQLGIDRRTEYTCAQAAFAAGIGPEVVAFFAEHGAMVSRFVPGRVLVPQTTRTPVMLRRVIESLRRYHARPDGAGKFSAFDTVRRYYALARKHHVAFPLEIVSALETLERIKREIGIPNRLCHCHNDLLPSNLVHHKRAIWILDWEYAGLGDVFFDLGNLAANTLLSAAQETKLLEYYFGNAGADDLRRVRLMRRVSDLRESMWGFLQMGISKLDFDYREYAHRHLRRFLESGSRGD